MLMRFEGGSGEKLLVSIPNIAAFEEVEGGKVTLLYFTGGGSLTIKGGLDENTKKIGEEMRKMAIATGQMAGGLVR